MVCVNQPSDRFERGGTCQVVIIGEDDVTHAKAETLCHKLAKRFSGDIQFTCRGWLFSSLVSSECARDAAHAAARAGLVIFAVHAESEMPELVQMWIESWVGERHGREGALISLAGNDAPILDLETAPKQMYLRQVARRARMDFLSDFAHVLPLAVPESQEWFVRRADNVGSIMDGILNHAANHPRPPGLDSRC